MPLAVNVLTFSFLFCPPCVSLQRHHQEKERRVAQERERVNREKELARKAGARTAAKAFLAGLQSNVVEALQKAGHLYDPVAKEVDGVFMPWLLQDVAAKMALIQHARTEVDNLIHGAISQLQFGVAEKQRVDAEIAAAERQRREEEAAAALRALEEAKRAALEAEAARVAKEAADAAEALRLEKAENGEDEDGGEDDGDDAAASDEEQ